MPLMGLLPSSRYPASEITSVRLRTSPAGSSRRVAPASTHFQNARGPAPPGPVSANHIQEFPMPDITLNTEQRLYVIPCAGGFTCFGFDNARDHAHEIARRLHRPDLPLAADEVGTLNGYEKYQAAVRAWGDSPKSSQTYFDPGTDPRLARVLETCRRERRQVRLILGDTSTGKSWLDEHYVVGAIGRSTGAMKVPLLIEPGEAGGMAIVCAHVLVVMDWDTSEPLYRHAMWQPPELRIRAGDNEQRTWSVDLHEQPVATFDDIGKAGAYVAFMRGASVQPRLFQ